MSRVMLVQMTSDELEQLIVRAVATARPASLPRFLRSGECARWLGCTEAAIRKWCRSSGMPYVRYGKERRFEPDAVLAWARARGRVLDVTPPAGRGDKLRVVRT